MLRGMVRCSNESANGFVIADTICETRRSKRIDLRIESYSQQGTSWGRMRARIIAPLARNRARFLAVPLWISRSRKSRTDCLVQSLSRKP